MVNHRSAEHLQFQAVAREFMTTRFPDERTRELMLDERGFDEATWRAMASQLGLLGLTIPEEYGGSGYTSVELGIVLEEMGRCLAGTPYFGTVVLAVNAILESGDQQAAAQLLPGIAGGNVRASLAVLEPGTRWERPVITSTAVPASDHWRINGNKSFVLDGLIADLVIVVARTARGIGLFSINAPADGMTIRAMGALDQTRKLADMSFIDTPATPLGSDTEGWRTVTRVLELAAIALAAEQVGGAQRCLDMAVEYSKSRIQFGRPIGSFQAIKHSCADTLVRVELARSAAYHAARCAAGRTPDLPAMANLVHTCCSDAYLAAAKVNIQVHGGIGVTWEHPAHRYFKRAKSSQLLFGDPSFHRERLAVKVGI
ncbi:alkylation response protein AidB-like acyl-CoA dehydrogenase [Tamaricihabitans halophyticus]|uniref:Alkylation response protein AidB-like acyl-CoA dehydrogenase n=1 Tax=Tamaricihabitans halophyticus TaxID=1262583 RepID=A0A4R2QUS9_9PSEU|nr:acyl-CoA dehydrogenase family protein [Tamaricihabitans halophyticus]TCP53477.1 alkylation response protein AidB-like acyl-CoA dehydrogenase [Tamaricihabitans halophyticus]